MKILVAASVTFVILVSATLYAQKGSRVYLDPHDGFSAYFSSAIEKKKVPVTVTTNPKLADYTVKFQAKNSNGSLVQAIESTVKNGSYDSGAFNEVSMSVTDTKTGDVTFSYTCRKYNKYGGDATRADSVAECLAKHWKDKLSKQ